MCFFINLGPYLYNEENEVMPQSSMFFAILKNKLTVLRFQFTQNDAESEKIMKILGKPIHGTDNITSLLLSWDRAKQNIQIPVTMLLIGRSLLKSELHMSCPQGTCWRF